MKHEYRFTLQSAQDAERKGQLFVWTQEYLRTDGYNNGLADNLLEGKPTISVLREFPLQKLKRIMGPEVGMNYQEEINIWEKRIRSLVDKIQEGILFPPLIVTDFWKDLELADGSHRHEALLRSGYTSYWTIFFFNKKESLRLLDIIRA